MPQPKGKKKKKQQGGKQGKRKGHGGPNKPHHKQHGQQHQNKPPKDRKNKASPQNHTKHLNNKQQQELLQTRMIDSIDSMYSQYTKKHEPMRTFFGIFTKQNQDQLRELWKASIPYVNKQLNDKYLKTTQYDECRDINAFIYLGDVVMGSFATELKNNSKDCVIKAFCVLPYFRNFGFGSRLLVHLIKNCVKRKKLVTMSLFIDEENQKGISFFERFGFKVLNQDKGNEKNGLNKKANEKKEEKNELTDMEIKTIKMRLDLRIFRSSVMVLVKKQLKAEASNKSTPQKSPKNQKDNET